MALRLSGANTSGPAFTASFTSAITKRRLKMFTSGHDQKYASRATSFAYSSVILTRVSGPGAIARDQLRVGCTLMLASTVVAAFAFAVFEVMFLLLAR